MQLILRKKINNNNNNYNNCLFKYNVNTTVCRSTIKIRHNLKIRDYKWF